MLVACLKETLTFGIDFLYTGLVYWGIVYGF